jgi:sugar-specific transcriptional regulator TrmB
MNIQQLIDIGFTENQAKVYFSLFKKPGSSAGEISKETSLDRSFVYTVIESLIKKGLVYSSLIKNRRVFYSENPLRIID